MYGALIGAGISALGSLMGGDDTASQRQNEIYNKISNYDNRQNDFRQFAGGALNGLANRGVVNSTVASNALARGLTEADRTYWNNQMGLAGHAFSQQDQEGAAGGIFGGLANMGGNAVGGLFGNMFGKKG